MVAAQKVESAITAALAKDNKELAAQYRANKSLIVGLAGEIERLTLAEKALNDEFENSIKQEKENIKVGEDALQTNQALISSLEEEIKMLQMSGAELAVYVELQKLDAKVTTEQTAAFSAQVEALVSQREALKAASLAGEEYTDVMNDQLSQGEQLFQGMTRGIENYGEEAQDVFSMAEKAASSAFSSMEDALVDMASSGKMAFSDMATSILKDILRIVIRSQILGPIAQMLGGSMASSFGGAAAGEVTRMPSTPIPTTFASAGHNAKGGSYIVPGVGGTDSTLMSMRVTPGEHVQVTPSGKSGMGGGFSQTVNVVNNVPEARVSTQTGPNGRDLEIYIEQVAARSIANNGAVGRAMDQSRGTAPRGIPR
jgi:lambda family phage tail tape measure protein